MNRCLGRKAVITEAFWAPSSSSTHPEWHWRHRANDAKPFTATASATFPHANSTSLQTIGASLVSSMSIERPLLEFQARSQGFL
eukprot:2780049-Amphidinium_carterae.1